MNKIILDEVDYKLIVDYIQITNMRFGIPSKVLEAINRAQKADLKKEKKEENKEGK